GIDEAPPPRLDNAALVPTRRLERAIPGPAYGELHVAPGEVAHHELDGLGDPAVAEPEPDDDLLEPEMSRRRGQALCDALHRLGRQVERRGDGDGDPVPV